MHGTPLKIALLAWPALLLLACSSGSTGPVTTSSHVVTLSWNANHESGVNRAGGGYRVIIDGGAPIDVPYVSGALAPTTKDVTLWTGRHVVTVTAYAALDASGGTTGSASAPSQALTVDVP